MIILKVVCLLLRIVSGMTEYNRMGCSLWFDVSMKFGYIVNFITGNDLV